MFFLSLILNREWARMDAKMGRKRESGASRNGQEEQHRKSSFQDEIVMLLKKHRIQYDERYLWG